MTRIKKLIMTFAVCIMILQSFNYVRAETTGIEAPETVDEVKALGEKTLQVGEKELPGIIKNIWKEDVLPIWQKMYNWFNSRYGERIKSWIERIVKPEIEKRKPAVEEEFQKEKTELNEEVRQGLPKIWHLIWEKIKELTAAK